MSYEAALTSLDYLVFLLPCSLGAARVQELSKSSDQDLMMLLPYVQAGQVAAQKPSWPSEQDHHLPGKLSELPFCGEAHVQDAATSMRHTLPSPGSRATACQPWVQAG